jgi:hypothetical protein
MLYLLRLTSGDCIVTEAHSEIGARAFASTIGLQDGESIATLRALPRFGVRLSPTEEGSLQVESWDDATLDDVLEHEYPILNDAFRKANSVRFMPQSNPQKPLLNQLRNAHEQNAEIIRKGLREEQRRFATDPPVPVRKIASK